MHLPHVTVSLAIPLHAVGARLFSCLICFSDLLIGFLFLQGCVYKKNMFDLVSFFFYLGTFKILFSCFLTFLSTRLPLNTTSNADCMASAHYAFLYTALAFAALNIHFQKEEGMLANSAPHLPAFFLRVHRSSHDNHTYIIYHRFSLV